MLEQLACVVDRILFQKDGSPWRIIKTDKGVCKGSIPWEPEEGERLRLFGTWQRSKYDGAPEFAFKSATTDIPRDPRALLEYAVEITPGLGAKKADAIWQFYKEDWPKSDLSEIKGLRHSTRHAWQDTLDRIRNEGEKATVVAFFMDMGLTPNLALKAWDLWQAGAIGVVKSNPYNLTALPGVGFKTVDREIAPRFGIAKDDDRRYFAAIEFCMNQICDDGGHTVVQLDTIEQEFNRLIGLEGQTDVQHYLRELDANGKIEWAASGRYAIARDYTHEKAIMEYLTT